jgi:hypothetical protein
VSNRAQRVNAGDWIAVMMQSMQEGKRLHHDVCGRVSFTSTLRCQYLRSSQQLMNGPSIDLWISTAARGTVHTTA